LGVCALSVAGDLQRWGRHWDEASAALHIGNAWRLKLLLGW